MTEDDSLSSPKRPAVAVIIQRHGQIALSFSSAFSLPFQKLFERGGATYAAGLIVALNHITHVTNFACAIFADDHIPTNMRALSWDFAFYGCELMIWQGTVIQRHGAVV